jgi:predicted nucleic acid-binding protein
VKLLDTTVAVDHLRGRPRATELVVDEIEGDDPLAASEMVRFELVAGVRGGELADLEELFTALAWIPVTEEISSTAGLLAGRYRPSHSGIDDVDYLIAATALVLDAELLTTNVRHFPMFRGLRPPY